MKNRYQYKMNIPPLTEEQVKRHQDFDALLQAYREGEVAARGQKGSARIVRILAPWATIAALLVGAYFLFRPADPAAVHQARQTAYFAAQPFVQPPLKEIEPVFEQRSLTADKGGVIEFPSGSRLQVPAAAFIDAQGAVVSGPVNIKFREMHDFVDFFLAGIPMHYDSAGQRYHLESAGMVEVYAEQNGQALQLHPGKALDVELVSQITTTDWEVPKGFNVYRLNPSARNWEYQAPDQMALLEEDANSPSRLLNTAPRQYLQQKLEKELDEIQTAKANALAQLESEYPLPPKPEKPTSSNGTDMAFAMEFEEEDIDWSGVLPQGESMTEAEKNQLKERYKNGLWQVAPGSDFNRDLLGKVTWDDARLKRLSDRRFELTLIQENASLTLIVNPVLSPQEFEQAMQDYEQSLEEYNNLLAARAEGLENPRTKLEATYAAKTSEAQSRYQENLAALEDKGKQFLAKQERITRKVRNTFTIDELGIWNCDKPIPAPESKVKGEFVLDGFEEGTGYLVDRGRNTVFRFYAYDGCRIPKPAAGTDQLLWVVQEDQRLAVFRPEDFSLTDESIDALTLDMEVIDQPLQSEEDVRRVLYF